MRRYDLAVFDLDGTILDTTEGVLAAAKHTIKAFDLAMPDTQTLLGFIGPPIQDSFARTYGLSGDILQEMATVFRDQYKNVDLLKAIPYEGIYDVFGGLAERGIATAVATYKREDYAITLLRHFHFDDYTAIMHGSDHLNKLRKEDVIRLCIQEARIQDIARVVMVGDTVHDADGARKAGLDFVGVTFGFGFHSPEDVKKSGAIGCADNALQLLDIIK